MSLVDTQPRTPSVSLPSVGLDRHPEAQELIRRAPMSYVWNQISSLWLFGATFLFTIILTRNLSTTRYGDLSSALTVYNTAVYLAAFGLEDAATVFIPRTLAEQGKAAAAVIIRRTLLSRLIGVVIVALTMVFGIPALAHLLQMLSIPFGANLEKALAVPGLDELAGPVALYMAGTGLLNVLAAVFTSILRTRLTLIVNGLQQAGVLAGTWLAIRAGYDIYGVLLAVGAVTGVAAAIYLVLLTPYLTPARPANAPAYAPVLQMGWTAWLTNLISGALLKQLAVSLIQSLVVVGSVSVSVAYFNVAFQLTHAAAYLLIAGLGGVGMAAMAAAYAGENQRSLAFAWRAVSKAQILLAVPLLTFFFVYANAIPVVLYGNKYQAVGPLMQIFLVFNILQRVAGGGAHQAALYVVGKQRWAFLTQWLGLIVTIIIGYLLIPQTGTYGGAAGALIAVGTGQVLVEFAQLFLSTVFLKSKYPIRFGVRVVLALVPPTALIWFWHPRGLSALVAHAVHLPTALVELVIAVTAYLIVLLISLSVARPIEPEDVTLLAEVNPRLRPVLRPFAQGIDLHLSPSQKLKSVKKP